MMKRSVPFLFGFAFIVSVILLFSSCDRVSPSATTGKSLGEEDTTGGNQAECCKALEFYAGGLSGEQRQRY